MTGPLIPGLREDQAAAAGSVAVVFVAALAITTTFDARPASADLEITERNGRVEARLVDIETRPRVVEDALRDAGIDADVTAVPVSPSIVGRFVNYQASAGDAGLEPLDGDSITAQGFSVPEHFAGHLELNLGRPARAGEQYVTGGNALSAGEPLACLDLQHHPVSELADVAATHPGLSFRLQPLDPTFTIPPTSLTLADLPDSPVAGWKVAYLQTLQPDLVFVTVTPDGQLAGLENFPPIVGC